MVLAAQVVQLEALVLAARAARAAQQEPQPTYLSAVLLGITTVRFNFLLTRPAVLLAPPAPVVLADQEAREQQGLLVRVLTAALVVLVVQQPPAEQAVLSMAAVLSVTITREERSVMRMLGVVWKLLAAQAVLAARSMLAGWSGTILPLAWFSMVGLLAM